MTHLTPCVVLSTTFVLVIGTALLVDASSSSSSDPLAPMVSTHSSSGDSITITAAPTAVQSTTGTPPASSSGLESWQKTLIIVGSILLAFFALMAFLNYKCNQDDAAHSTARSSKQNNNLKNQAREIDPDECPHTTVEMECPPSCPSDGVEGKSAKPVLTASAFEKYAKQQDNSPRKEQGVGAKNDPMAKIDTTLGWVQEQQQHYEPVFPPPIPPPSPISHSSVEVVESTSRPRRTSSQKQQKQQHPPLTVAESILFGTAPKDTKAAGGTVEEKDSKKKQRSHMKKYDAIIMDVSVEQLDVDLTSGDEDHHDHSKAQVLSPSPKNSNKLHHDERIEGDFEDEFVTDLNQPQYEQQPQEVFSRYHVDHRKKDDDVPLINEDTPSFRTVDTYHSTTGSQADPSFVVSEERSELPLEEGNHHHSSPNNNNNNLALSQSMIEIENPSSPTKCRLRRKASRSTTATVTSSMRTNPTTDHTSSFCSSAASVRNEGEAIAPEDLSGFGVEPSAAAHAPTTVTKRTSSLVPSRSVYGGRSTPSSALHATNLAAAARAPPSATYPQTPSFLRVPKTNGNGHSMKK